MKWTGSPSHSGMLSSCACFVVVCFCFSSYWHWIASLPQCFQTWSLCLSWFSLWWGRAAGSWPVWTHWWALPASWLSTWWRAGSTAFECAPSTSTASVSPRSPADQSGWPNLKVSAHRGAQVTSEKVQAGGAPCLFHAGLPAHFCCHQDNQLPLKC